MRVYEDEFNRWVWIGGLANVAYMRGVSKHLRLESNFYGFILAVQPLFNYKLT